MSTLVLDLQGKKLLDYANLFYRNEHEKNDIKYWNISITLS